MQHVRPARLLAGLLLQPPLRNFRLAAEGPQRRFDLRGRITAAENVACDGETEFLRSSCMRRHTLIMSVAVLVLSADLTLLCADEKPLFAPRPTKDAKASKTHAKARDI
jgi:hypothetical protein